MRYDLVQGEAFVLDITDIKLDGVAVSNFDEYEVSFALKYNVKNTDANADILIDSTTNASRFVLSSNSVEIEGITSAESNDLDTKYYVYEVWAYKSSTEYLVDRGEIRILETAYADKI